jgi:hypothetical protein
MTYIIGALCSLSCCFLFVLLMLAIIGGMFLRKKGKQKVTAREAIQAGMEQSRAFIRGEKSREQMLQEEDEEERRR